MGVIYGAFCITLGVAMAVNMIIKSKNDSLEPTTLPWLFVGLPYIIMLIVIGTVNNSTSLSIYLFQIASTLALLWYVRALEFRFIFISKLLSAGAGMFVAAWTIMAFLSDAERFTVLLPSTIVMMLLSFILAVYFFIRSDEEILLKSMLGGLFTVIGIIKIMYIIDANSQSAIFYLGLFVLDYMIYLVISFLLFFNTQYKKAINKNIGFATMKGIINEVPIGFVTLSRSGDIIVSNNFIDLRLKSQGITKGTIYDLFDAFPVIDRFYYQIEWKRILVALDMRRRYVKNRVIADEINKEIQFDFHLIDIYSSNNSEIYLNIYQNEIENIDFNIDDQVDYVDKLTGLPDKVMMGHFFDKQIYDEKSEYFAVVLMSISNYREMVKYIGTDLAEEYMAILTGYIGEVDQIASIGKVNMDTFELITKEIKKDQIEDIVNDLIMNLKTPFKHKDHEIETKPLVGVAIYPHNGVSHGELIKSARIALGKASLTKNEQVQYCDIEFMKTLHNKKAIEEKLKNAILNDELYMMYQPQYDTYNEVFRGFEALLRWGNSDADFISPNVFIPIAEDTGMMNEIGEWVLRHAIVKGKKWQQRFEQEFIMSVNVSSMQLERPGLALLIEQILEEHHYKASLLEIEITETGLMRSSEEVYKELRAIKVLGVKIALDDFGTGYSSLDYLRWLPFDVLKIDKSFIDNLNDDSIEREIVHSVIGLVNKMELETVAEGVENLEQLKALQASSCSYIQGNLFSKPLLDDEVEAILAKHNE